MFRIYSSFPQTIFFQRSLRLIFLGLIIGLSGIVFLPNYEVTGQQTAIQSCPTCRPPSQQIIYAPLIELKEASYTEINLNCRSAHPIDVVPTFYTDAGSPIVGETIHLLPAEMRFVDVKSLIPAEHRNDHKWGGMSLSYTGNLMEVWGQLTLHGIGKKGSTNVLFAVIDAPRSNVSGAVWRMPKNAAATIVLGNYSDTASSAILTFSNGDAEIVNLAPYQTGVINHKSNGQNQTNGVEAESVVINSSGQPGRLITTGLVISKNGDFASSVRFYDTGNFAQPNLYSTNFRLKDTTPHIVLKNTTANTITARTRFLPVTGEGSGVVELPVVTLPPYTVKELNLTSLTNAAKTRSDIDTVSVQIINSGDKGSLIGAANFTNNITGVDYDIPLRDSGAAQNSAGGYPVRLDDDYTTNLSLTNVGDKAGKFTLQVNFDGGIYAMYPRELAPGETAAFDFRKLRDRQIPDSSGRVLPANLTVAQIRWSMVGGVQTRIIGRSEVISKSGKVSSSYSCGICCMNSYESSLLSPDQVFAFLGGETQFTVMQKDRDCYGNHFAEYAVSGAYWESSDDSIVDASYNGMAVALDVGDVQITATWETQYFLDSGSDTCDMYPLTVTRTAGMIVQPPTVSTSLAIVGKDQTRTISVQVTQNPNHKTIAFSISRTQGNTGAAEFVGSNTTTANNQTVSFQIKGTVESDVKDNVVLQAKVNNTPIPNSKSFSVAKIKISRTIGTQQPTVITDMTTVTIVGERIKLNAEIVPSGITASSQMWTIPNTIVKDFVVTSNNQQGMSVPVDPLNTPNTNFVWVDGGGMNVNDFISKEVKYDAITDGQTLTGKSIFQVKRPVVDIRTTTTTTHFFNNSPNYKLIFGDDSDINNIIPGIKFMNQFSPMFPANFGGTTQWVQIVSHSSRIVKRNGTTVYTDNPQSGLDGCYPYATRGSGTTRDSPFFEFGANIAPNDVVNINTDDDFVMWYMFQPSSPEAVWVPLKSINWYWNAQATFNMSWTYSGTNSPNSVFTNTTNFPSWASIVPDRNNECP